MRLLTIVVVSAFLVGVATAAYAPPKPGRTGLELARSGDPSVRIVYLAGFRACARAAIDAKLPTLQQVKAATRRDAALRLLHLAQPLVRRALPKRYPHAFRTAMKGCADALRIGLVHARAIPFARLPVRVLRPANPRVAVYGESKLRLTVPAVKAIALRIADPRFLQITDIAALPSKYRKNEYLHTRNGLGEARGPIWVVKGRVQFHNECTHVPPGQSCPRLLEGAGYVVIEDATGRIVESAAGTR